MLKDAYILVHMPAMFATVCALMASGPAFADDQAGGLRNLIGGLYGGNGITLAVPAQPNVPSHAAHFTASSRSALNNLGNTISSSISQLSFNSSVSSVAFDLESGEAVKTRDSLGPIVSERAQTLGKGRVNFGASTTYVEYKQLDGVSLKHLHLDLKHQDLPGTFEFEEDIVRLNIDLKFRQQVFAVYANYGLSESLDAGVIVPIVHMKGSVFSHGEIIPVNADTIGIHQFGAVSPDSSNSGDAVGLGDIVARAKWNVSKARALPVDAALLGQVTLPTGDEGDLLGTGSTAVYFGGVASKVLGRFTPHLNGGYEYYFKTDVSGFDRSNTRLTAGFDFKASNRLAFSADMLARWEREGADTRDLALGAKWEAVENLPISINFIVPFNRDKGLRPDFVFSIGLERAF